MSEEKKLEKEVGELKKEVENLSNTISQLNGRITRLEKLINSGFSDLKVKFTNENIVLGSTLHSDIELDDTIDLEDSLTPQDLLILPGPLQDTAKALIPLRISTADEISKKTGKQRAVESSYLNQLVERNYCRKIRIGRKIFFYTGPSADLLPFKSLNSEFRDIILAVIRSANVSESISTLNIKDIFDAYNEILDREKRDTVEEFEKLMNLTINNLNFVSNNNGSKNQSLKEIKFNKALWRKGIKIY